MLTLVRRLAMGATALLVVADATFAGALWLTRPPAPRPLTAQRVFELARPATVLVQAHFLIKTSLPDTRVSADGESRLTAQLQHMIDTRQIPYNSDAIDHAALDLILGDPGGYIGTEPTRSTDDVDLVSTGTGFFVTDSGYLVTASHVAAPTKDDIRAALLDFKSNPDVEDAIKSGLADSIHADWGISPTDAQLSSLLHWTEDFAQRNLSIDSVDAKFYLGTGTVQAGSQLEAAGARAQLVGADAPYPDRDVALLKADVSSVPGLDIAPGAPRLDEPAYVVGYPRVGYLNEEPPADQAVPVAFTQGRSETQAPHPDFTAVGTTALVSHGNSGGPVLDGSGRIVGMISYGSFSDGSDQGQGWFITAPAIRDRLAAAGIKPAGSRLTSEYRQALDEGDSHRYRPELVQLEAIHRASPWDTYVADDISTVQSALLSGQDRTPPDLSPYSGTVAMATVILAVGLLLTTVGTVAAGRRRADQGGE